MDKLHILLICPDGRDFRMVKQTGTLTLALQATGIRVSLLVGGVKTSQLDSLHPDISTYHAFYHHKWLPEAVCHPLSLIRQLKKCLDKDTTIDIVHLINCRWPFSLLSRITRRYDIPTIARVQSEDHITGNGLAFWQKRLHQKALKDFMPLVVSSNHLLETARKNDLMDVVYIPEGVNVEHFKPVLSKRPIRRALNLPEKATLICCMASIHPQNNQMALLEKCVPLGDNRHILFVGQVEDKDYLKQLKAFAAQEHADESVHFLDAVDNPEDYLKAADIFMLLGGIEDRHTTVLEAQSAGLPVILAPCPSALMLTNSNRCGVVLYPNNPLARQAFEKLLNDPTYRQGRAINTRPYVKKEFPFKKMVASYYKLYNSL